MKHKVTVNKQKQRKGMLKQIPKYQPAVKFNSMK